MNSFELRDAQGFKFKIDKEWVRVGRNDDNDIVFRDATVSRYHLNFYIKDGQLIVENAGSQNGFLVNGQPATGAVFLNLGDHLYFGSREFLVGRPDVRGGAGNEFSQSASSNGATQNLNSRPAATFNATFNLADASSMPSKRTFIYGGLAAFVIFMVVSNKKSEEISRVPASSDSDFAAAPLSADGYGADAFTQKSLTEVQAEGRFREAQRDFNNENLSRALLGFQEALTLNPGHEGAMEYLERTESEQKKRLTELLKDAQRSYQLQQFRRSKERALRVITALSDENPNYGRKIAEEGALSTAQKNQGQEEILLAFPCKEARESKICETALDIVTRSRERLGDQDVIK